MADPSDVLGQLRDQLVAGIPRFERRRRARRLQTTAGVVVLLATTAAFVASLTGTDESQVSVQGTAETPSCPDGSPGFTVEQLSDTGVPAVLFASNVNTETVAVSDLDGGCLAVYPEGAHTLGRSVIDAAFTSNDKLISVPFTDSIRVYPAGRAADGRHELVDGGLRDPGRQIQAPDHDAAFPTDDGDAVWVLPRTTELDRDKTMELVDVETGEVRARVNVPGPSVLVDVVGDNAVLHPAASKSDGTGGTFTVLTPGSDILEVSPQGETTTLASPEGTAGFITRIPGRTIWFGGNFQYREASGGLLHVVADDGENTSVTPPGDEGRQWVDPSGGSFNRSRSRIATADGTRLLLWLADRSDPNRTPNRLAVVDLNDDMTTVFDVSPGDVFWARDDRTAVVVRSGRDGQSVTAIDTVTGTTKTIDNALPDGDFFFLASR